MAQADPAPVRLEIHKGAESVLTVGGLRVVACRREVGDIDGGVSVYVFADEAGEAGPELLRLDLFRKRPHYHAPAENQDETAIDARGDGAVDWGIERLARSAPALVREAGFPEIADALDEAALAQARDALRRLFTGLGAPTEVSAFDVPAEVLARLREAAST